MESATVNTFPRTRLNFLPLVLITIGLLIFVSYWSSKGPTSYGRLQPERLEMTKKSGKNDKHASPKAREKAAQEYEQIKAEYQEWLKKPNKSEADKKTIGKLRKKLERLRKKKDFTGENHSQNKKGN